MNTIYGLLTIAAAISSVWVIGMINTVIGKRYDGSPLSKLACLMWLGIPYLQWRGSSRLSLAEYNDEGYWIKGSITVISWMLMYSIGTMLYYSSMFLGVALYG